MKKTALLVALSLSVFACDSGSDDGAAADGGLGDVALNDSTDATGKADALNGRAVRPYFTGISEYGPETQRGTSSVIDIDDQSMTTEAPMLQLPQVDEFLQVTVTGDSDDTAMRFFLVYSRDGSSYEIVTVTGQGEFDEGEGPEGESTAVPVDLSYFASASIDLEANKISVTSDDSAGETTADLSVDAAAGTFFVYPFPVDSGWGNDLVGDFAFGFDARCDGVSCGEEPAEPDAPVDDYAQARDVSAGTVTIGGPAIDYTRANVDGFSLGGTEFWQRDESGGIDKTFSYGNGSEEGRKCMLASAIRFEAIMADPPASMVELRDNSNWSGSFFNWNEDKTVRNWPARAGLWAWTTGLMKWISVTNPDGTCSLPTLELVEAAAAECLRTADGADGETKGCAAGF